ncbi:ferredoxin [Pontiellaceae bacterium B12227]|nr:ferredoxin [Pontiellaceae bacterium B12227]
MKAAVDPDRCIGCGVCEQICNTVFEMDDNLAKVKVETVPTDAEAGCQDAADACPVNAIAIIE